MSAYDEILSSSNIINILEYYGLKVVKNKCICPFHSDTHPSMMVNTSKGIANVLLVALEEMLYHLSKNMKQK